MSDTPPPDISHDQHAVRRAKLAEMRAGGFDPFRANVATTHFSADAKALYVEGQDNVVSVTVAGRLVTFRVQGGSSFVKIQDFPAVMKQAIIAAEDERFYQHGGIDYYGVVRAAVRNIKDGRIVQGASTLTS